VSDTGQPGQAGQAEQGMQVRREVLGDELQDFITRYAWGEIWSRPGLTRAERSIITLTALAALRQDEELAMHVRGAVRNGLTPEQIREVLLQVAVYAGVPAANRGFAVAQGVLAELAAQDGQAATGEHRPAE
jgi:alkylhydroperoxidase/carboxymuconolactone decarboxylase family protein YurZ